MVEYVRRLRQSFVLSRLPLHVNALAINTHDGTPAVYTHWIVSLNRALAKKCFIALTEQTELLSRKRHNIQNYGTKKSLKIFTSDGSKFDLSPIFYENLYGFLSSIDFKKDYELIH